MLAVRAEPAEAEPRDEVAFTALVVDSNGHAPAPAWAFCTARKPLAELGPVNATCYDRAATSLAPLGTGSAVKGVMPESACRDFGPEVPQAKPGEPYGRPADPDPTGGYYQPVSLFVADETAVAAARIACSLAGAPSDDVATYRQRYHANENPAVSGLLVDGSAVEDGATVHVAVSSGVGLRVQWANCPVTDACGDGICGPDESRASCANDCGTPKGCSGAERYLFFDAGERRLVTRREAIRVSWFTTAGSFDRDRTGSAEDDPTDFSDNVWHAPDTNGPVRGWVVLRDDRGGSAWRSFVLDVR